MDACATVPSLTVVKIESGYKPSKYGNCARFTPHSIEDYFKKREMTYK